MASKKAASTEDVLELVDLVGVVGREDHTHGQRASAIAAAWMPARVVVPASARSRSEFSSRAVERCALGRALHLDEEAAAGDDDVHVGLGADVLHVREVEHRFAVDDPDRDGGDRVDERASPSGR